MNYSYVTYNANQGVVRNARPQVLVAVTAMILVSVVAILSNIGSGYIAQSPYSNSVSISAKAAQAAATAPITSASTPSGNPSRMFSTLMTGGMSGMSLPVPATQPSSITASPESATTNTVAMPTPSVQTPSIGTPVVDVPVVPSVPPTETPGEGGGGILPIPQPEVPCLCGVTEPLNDTLDTVVDVLPVQLFN